MKDNKESIKDAGNSCYHPMRFGEALESRRWLILLSVFSFYVSSAIGWLTYNATTGPSMRYFNITADQLLFFTDVNMYICLLLSFVGCWLAYKYFKVSLIVCTFVNGLAAWIRYLGGSNYMIALLCQILIGLAAIPLFGFAILVPDRWFPTKERFAVNSLSVFANYVGWTLGGLIPCFIVEDDETKIPQNTKVQAILLTIPFILAVTFGKERPNVPPSYSALVKQIDNKSFWKQLKTLLKTRRFIGSSLCFGIVLGLSNSIPTTNGIFMDPLQLSYLNQGLITAGYVVTGLISGLIGTFWIEKKGLKNIDFILKILLSISFFSLIALGVVFVYVENPNMLLILICNCVLGIGLIGFMPFGCSSIIESNFPIQEAVSTNVMSSLANILSIMASHLSVTSFVGKGGYLVLAGFMLPAWIYSMFFHKTEFKKQEADEKHQDIDKEVENSKLYGLNSSEKN